MELPNSDILLDSNVLIYASNKKSSKYKKAKDIIKLVKNGRILAVISHQNILETFRVLTHKKFPKPFTNVEAIKQVKSFSQICNIIYPQFKTLELTLEFTKHLKLKENKIFDAYLVSTMISNGVKYILTDNTKDLRKFKEIKVINPFS